MNARRRPLKTIRVGEPCSIIPVPLPFTLSESKWNDGTGVLLLSLSLQPNKHSDTADALQRGGTVSSQFMMCQEIQSRHESCFWILLLWFTVQQTWQEHKAEMSCTVLIYISSWLLNCCPSAANKYRLPKPSSQPYQLALLFTTLKHKNCNSGQISTVQDHQLTPSVVMKAEPLFQSTAYCIRQTYRQNSLHESRHNLTTRYVTSWDNLLK